MFCVVCGVNVVIQGGQQYCTWLITSDMARKAESGLCVVELVDGACQLPDFRKGRLRKPAIWTRTSCLPNANIGLNGTVLNDSWLDVRKLLTAFSCNLTPLFSLQSKNSLFFFDCPDSGRSKILRTVGSKLPISTAPHQNNCHRHLDRCVSSSYERRCR